MAWTSAVATPCDVPPVEVANYLKSQSQWTLLQSNELERDDQVLWLKGHPGKCPGLAVARLDTQAGPSYAMALLNRKTHKEKVVLLQRSSGRPHAVSLGIPVRVGNPAVVWTIGPGELREWDSDRRVRHRFDGVVLEQLESSAVVYYLDRGRVREITVSD